MKPATEQKEKMIQRETLAEAIGKISEAVEAILKSGINRRAIVALIADKSKLGKSTIEIVLNNLEDLKRDYCR